MKFTLKVGKAEQYHDIDQNETRLRVPFEIIDADGTAVSSMNESFALDTSQEDILATLKRHLAVFTEEQANAAASRERQAALDAAEEVAGEISNIVIE